eukprot:m.360458 g.360458  ORF g.360458 m.360458 type:complete len:55 (-) comp19056_c0_seq1:2185-2349(-)
MNAHRLTDSTALTHTQTQILACDLSHSLGCNQKQQAKAKHSQPVTPRSHSHSRS